MTSYITVDEVQRELASGSGQINIGENYADIMTAMILEASRLVDGFKGVEDGAYDAAASATEREFFGSGTAHQLIDYCTSVTAVTVEETDGTDTAWVADTDYFTWPYEATALAEPIRRLDVNPKSGTTKSVWTYGPKRVKVTGTWGISDTAPETIKRAVKIQVQRWWKRAAQGWTDASAAPQVGQLLYTQELDPDVKRALRSTFPHMPRI